MEDSGILLFVVAVVVAVVVVAVVVVVHCTSVNLSWLLLDGVLPLCSLGWHPRLLLSHSIVIIWGMPIIFVHAYCFCWPNNFLDIKDYVYFSF